MLKRNKIFFILILAFLLRSLFLGLFPNNLTTDELHFVINSKSVFYQFSDISHSWNPLSLKTIPSESSSELPFLLLAPFIGPLPLSLFYSKLIYAVIGVLSAYLLFLICKKLFNQKIALITALIYTLNPWAIYVSRTAFDAPLAILFYLLTLYLLLIYKKQKILLAFIPALIAFYCYIGTKIIFIPIMLVYLFYAYLNNKKDKKYYIILFLLSIFLVITYYLRIGEGSRRISELATPNNEQIISQSVLDRGQSIKTPLRYIFSNKYAVFFQHFSTKYFENFSPDVLFLKGDPTYLLSLWQHGYFYLIDFILIIFGLIALFNFNKQIFYLIMFLIALSPIPEAIRIDKIPAYAFHSCFQYPFLYILIAFGIYYLLSLKSKYLKLIIFSVYLISFINFFNIYFFRYPIYQSEGFFFSRQIVSQYLKLNSEKKITLISIEPDSFFRNYLFNGNYLNKLTINSISRQYQPKSRIFFKYNNVTFTNEIPDKFDSNTTYIIDRQNGYLPKDSYLVIDKLGDPVPQFYIINDKLCHQYKLDNYVHDVKLSDFNLNKMNTETFCQKYISNSL